MISDDNGNPRDYVCRHKSFAEVRLTEISGVNNKATRGVVYLLCVFRVRFVCKVLFVLPVVIVWQNINVDKTKYVVVCASFAVTKATSMVG